jgi:hypothetical protein
VIYEKEAAVAFAMHCDLNGLSVQQGLALAERIDDAITSAAEDRADHPEAEGGEKR